jgi:hypothetical protein
MENYRKRERKMARKEYENEKTTQKENKQINGRERKCEC